MKTFSRACLVLLAVLIGAAPAIALDATQPFKGRIDPNGDVRLTDKAKIGHFQGGKFISQVEKVDLLGSGSTGDVSSMSLKPLGGVAKTLLDLFGQRVDVTMFGAIADDSLDDSAAFNAAIDKANALAVAGKQVYLYIPPGRYDLKAVGLKQLARAVRVLGSALRTTFIKVDPAYPGVDVFWWSDAWIDGANNGANQSDPSKNFAGPGVARLTIIGDRSAAAIQNAITFYDRADLVQIDDVEVLYMRGSGLRTGVRKNNTESYIRESLIRNLRISDSGAPLYPSLHLASRANTSGPTGDSTNEIDLENINIVDSMGVEGLVIEGDAGTSTRLIRGRMIRVESTVGSDNIRIGSKDLAGLVNNVDLMHVDSENPRTGFAALRIAGTSSATQPFSIKIQGTNTSGAGDGVVIERGRNIEVSMQEIAAAGTSVVVGPNVGPDVTIKSPQGLDKNWRYKIDLASRDRVKFERTTAGSPSLGRRHTFEMHTLTTAAAQFNLTFPDGKPIIMQPNTTLAFSAKVVMRKADTPGAYASFVYPHVVANMDATPSTLVVKTGAGSERLAGGVGSDIKFSFVADTTTGAVNVNLCVPTPGWYVDFIADPAIQAGK